MGCDDLSPKSYPDFDYSHKFSQIVITEAAATCFAEQVARSKLSTFHMTAKSLNDMLKKTGLRFDTTSIKKEIPMLYSKLGKDKPLAFILSMRDAQVRFSRDEKDIEAQAIAQIRIFYDHTDPKGKGLSRGELFFDEFPIVTSADIQITNDVLQAQIDQF